MFALVHKGIEDSRLALARRLVCQLAAALPGRHLHVVADSAYAGRALRGLPAAVTWTTRLRANAALFELAPPRTGRRGRPRLKGRQLPALADLTDGAGSPRPRCTATAPPAPCTPRPCAACGTACSARNRFRSCWSATDRRHRLRHRADQHRPDRQPSTAHRTLRRALEHRGRHRRRQTDHRRRAGPQPVPAAVERTVPFTLIVTSVAICWYVLAGYQPDDVTAARDLAPWYRDKAQPSVADMIAKLRRVIIAAQYRQEHPEPLTPREISILRLAWEDAAA